IRRISADLHPSALDDFGLRIAVQLLCKEFEKLHNIKVTFRSTESKPERFEPSVEIALYRIAQEALANVAKHATGTTVSVQLAPRDHFVIFTIQDNGRGFDVNSPPSRKQTDRGLGLISMKERAEHLGGICEVRSSANSGTTIFVEVPV